MSNRTLVELNHDYCPLETKLEAWASDMRLYMSSGDPKFLPNGVTFKHIRHHSEPDPMAPSQSSLLQEAWEHLEVAICQHETLIGDKYLYCQKCQFHWREGETFHQAFAAKIEDFLKRRKEA